MNNSPFKIILIFIALIISGLAISPLLPIKLNPSGSLPGMTINFGWQGANGRVIEQEITSVLEGAFSKVRGIKNISSTSASGWGSIYIEVDKNVDLDAIRFEVASIIRQTYPSLPQGASYPQIYMQKADDNAYRPLLTYTINSEAPAINIQQYAENYIKPALSSVKGVSSINIYGASPLEWVIEYDAYVLKEYAVNVEDIQSAINTYLYSNWGGYGYELSHGRDTLVTLITIRNHSLKNIDFNKIPIKKSQNRIIYLKNIATVKHVEEEPSSYFRINGANTINIVIYAGERENQVKLGKAIKTQVELIEKQLPKGYFILKTYDATEFIVKELEKNIIRTVATLVILLLFVILVSWERKFLFLIVAGMIANLSIAIIFYYLLKVEMHLYSFAGITVSLGLIIDNCLMMVFHYRQQRNLKVFLASLAANLSTIGSLSVIFFMDERMRSYLSDLGIVIIINLIVSLGVVLFFLPALMEVMPLKSKSLKQRHRFLFFKFGGNLKQRRIIWFNQIYFKIIEFIGRFRVVVYIAAILAFGLPIFLLPNKIENDNKWWAKVYNSTLGNEWYATNIRPISDKILGGTLRLFVQHTFENSYYGSKEKTVLFIIPQMPSGATIEQMNDLLLPLERYLKQFKEIAQFQTQVSSNSAQIVVYFTEEAEKSGFPFMLKEMVTREANDMAGADWDVYGVGEGFSNSLRETVGQNKISLYGYNFDELYSLAEKIKKTLLETPRVQEVNILSQDTWYKNQSYEYIIGFDKARLALKQISSNTFQYALSGFTKSDYNIASTIVNGQVENIKLASKQGNNIDKWQVMHVMAPIGNTSARLKNVSYLKKEPVSLAICKENQQYRLILAYDYIGDYMMSNNFQKRIIEEIEPKLPIGYSIKTNNDFFFWDTQSKKQYWLLFLVIAIIFFIGAVLFESLALPFAVILMIPISYIGLFLTFYLFEINFDQGGFAAFILLSGITVNAALYIINDYNNLRRKYKNTGRDPKMFYYKAFNYKITPILLIILSTALGLVPFLWGGQKEVFWPAMAAGTIGGLLFSMIGIVFYLPLLLKIRLKKIEFKSKK